MRFALPLLCLVIGIGAGCWLKLLADDLNRAAHRRRRRPGTSFEPDVDPEEEDDHGAFSDGLRMLAADPNLPPNIRNKLRLFRVLQAVTIIAGAAAFLTTPR
ncbi:hypothetical protein [Brevundimonas sp.]|uniref:hypothetical protein n=1 Tax=Brevundimonas sp. TaxID=1871086 RepID=UPI002ED96131